MVYRCLFCKNTSAKEGVTVYRFPKDPTLCELWVQAMGSANSIISIPGSNAGLCSEHFKEDDLLKSCGRTILKRGAVPSKLNDTKTSESPLIPETVVQTVFSSQESDEISSSYTGLVPTIVLSNVQANIPATSDVSLLTADSGEQFISVQDNCLSPGDSLDLQLIPSCIPKSVDNLLDSQENCLSANSGVSLNLQLIPSCIPKPVVNLLDSQSSNYQGEFSFDRGLCLVTRELLVFGGVSDIVITSFCDKFNVALNSVIEQLVQDGFDAHIESVIKSINLSKYEISEALVENQDGGHLYNCFVMYDIKCTGT